jgi:hypothetical protein
LAISASAINQLLEAFVEAGGLRREVVLPAAVGDLLMQHGLTVRPPVVARITARATPALTGHTTSPHGKPLSEFHVAELEVAFGGARTPDGKEPLAYSLDFDGTVDLAKSTSGEGIRLQVMSEGTANARLLRGDALLDVFARPIVLAGLPQQLNDILDDELKPSLDFEGQHATITLLETVHRPTGAAAFLRVRF